METIRELVNKGRRRLARGLAESPGRETALLLGSLLELDEARLLAHDDRPVAPEVVRRFEALLSRRERGEPVAYLLGRREFHGREFRVDDRVLVPRPETEELVGHALALPLPEDARVLDVGTGSGAIALTLAAERPGWRVAASDLSLAALACARANRAALGLDRVALVAADLDRGLDVSRFDLVVSNPPYVDPAEPALVSSDVRTWEPHLALFAGEGGLATIARLLAAASRLAGGAFLAFEFGYGQRDALVALAARAPHLELRSLHDDAAGIPRVVIFRRTGGR